jgi:hypothetical protein
MSRHNPHARRYDKATAGQRFIKTEHKAAELSIAEQAKLLADLESNPKAFKEQVTLWRAQNPSDTMNIGSADAPTTIHGLDMAPYAGFDLSNVSLAGITLRGANFPDEPTVDAFYKAGASLIDYTVGENAAASRKQPQPVRPVAFAASAAKEVVGDNSARAIAARQAAALTEYARRISGR